MLRRHRLPDQALTRAPRGWRRYALPLTIVAALGVASPASALLGAGSSTIDRAAQGLRDKPVYVDPRSGDVLSQADANKLVDEIDSRNAGPLYIVVLPQAAADAVGGDPVGALRDIQSELRRPGVYAGIIGSHFRAGATGGLLPRGKAGALATAAFSAHHSDGAAAVLTDFVDRVGAARNGGGGNGSGSGSTTGLIVFGLIAAAIGALALTRRRRKRAELAEVKRVARDDLVALGDEIRALDVDVAMPNANTEAKQHYNQAVEIYQRAEQGLDRARSPQDLQPVSADLEQGRYEMQAARALLEGKEPPERRAPCFFDPRHGPSERMVDWAPAGGTPRPVPACAADAQRIEQGLDPSVRQIAYGGRQVPYWAAPAPYTPFFGGFYGDSFLPGLVVGEMLGGGWNDPGWTGSGASDGSSGGDFGGGDFGGGDFGGGGDSGGGGGDF